MSGPDYTPLCAVPGCDEERESPRGMWCAGHLADAPEFAKDPIFDPLTHRERAILTSGPRLKVVERRDEDAAAAELLAELLTHKRLNARERAAVEVALGWCPVRSYRLVGALALALAVLLGGCVGQPLLGAPLDGAPSVSRAAACELLSAAYETHASECGPAPACPFTAPVVPLERLERCVGHVADVEECATVPAVFEGCSR
ncbi:MAG: hypothetical protein SangKO_031990 [Sandaracinaceae bacterium]